MREDFELHDLLPSEWTREEVFLHLKKTFDEACKGYPGVMEPFAVLVADITDEQEAKALMWQALRETVRLRHPLAYQDLPADQGAREVAQ